MKLRRNLEEEDALVFEDIEPFFVELLRRIPASADPGTNAAANERLFADPVRAGTDPFNEDWREYVQPEIRDLFRSATEKVQEDLRSLPLGDPGTDLEDFTFDPDSFAPADHTFRLPREHMDAWLTTLNRARLVIAAKQGFGEEEMDEQIQFPPITVRDFSMFQMHFYDSLQQILMRALGFG